MRQEIRLCKSADGVRIAYAVSGSGPPLVLITSWVNHLEYSARMLPWNSWLDALSSEYTLLRYDTRGCGLSERGVADLTFESSVRDVEAVVEAAGFTRFAVLGICSGGPAAIVYAARHSQRVLDLVLHGTWGRGARSEGVDFAPTMVAKARSHYPGVTFTEANAERLPHPDASFDAVACGFGLLHMAQPERVMKEAWRVLRSGGRYTFTVWCGPDQGADFFGLILSAVQKHGRLDVPLPPAPPMFRFADPDESRRALAAAGFVSTQIRTLPIVWCPGHPQDVLDMIYKSTVRSPMLLGAQSAAAREAIHRAILEGAAQFRKKERLELKFPALMVSATKA